MIVTFVNSVVFKNCITGLYDVTSRDAVNDLALHFLAKMKIMVVKDIEREDVEFICKGLGCKPIASLDHFTADMLGSAELAEEMYAGSSKIVKVRAEHLVVW